MRAVLILAGVASVIGVTFLFLLSRSDEPASSASLGHPARPDGAELGGSSVPSRPTDDAQGRAGVSGSTRVPVEARPALLRLDEMREAAK